MIVDKLHRLATAVRREPGRDDAWLELARAAARTARSRIDLPPPAVTAPALRRVWTRHPGERSLAGLLLPLLDLEPVPGDLPVPGWWPASGQLGHADGEPFDQASGLPLRVRRVQDRTEMVLVPAGWFLGGEDPLREVELPDFYIDRVPLPARAYRKFAEASGRRPPKGWAAQLRRPGRPVVNVRIDDAVAYAAHVGARLPSGMEWEKAARGTDGRPYPWGREAPDPSLACYEQGPTHHWARLLPEAGRLLAGGSPFGALDMAGTVFEWCFREGTRGRSSPPPAGLPPRPHESRGGSWASPPDELAVTTRGAYYHPFRAPWLGFRLVKPLPPAGC